MKFMKTKSIVFSLLFGFALAFFAGCDSGGGGSSGLQPIPISSGHQITFNAGQTGFRYFSLYPPQEIRAPGTIRSTAWDIAFAPGRVVVTNSGVTATRVGSGGQGGVWHTERTDNFTGVTLNDRVTGGVHETRSTDAYVYMPGGMGEPPVRNAVNVMTHLGWDTGDGSSDLPYSWSNIPNAMGPAALRPFFNGAHAFFNGAPGMPPNFTATNRVYIIRHGCGIRYSVVQIGYASNNNMGTAPETYTLTFALLTSE